MDVEKKMKLHLSAITAIIFLFAGSTASATIVTTALTGTIVSPGNTIASIGDRLTVYATYDDKDDRIHEYNDGFNGIAESGEGDDWINITYCHDSEAGKSGCDYSTYDTASINADATLDFSAIVDILLTDPNIDSLRHAHNYNMSLYQESVSNIRAGLAQDHLSIDLFTGHDSVARLFYLDNLGNNKTSYIRVRMDDIITSAPTIPEPATIALMIL